MIDNITYHQMLRILTVVILRVVCNEVLLLTILSFQLKLEVLYVNKIKKHHKVKCPSFLP